MLDKGANRRCQRDESSQGPLSGVPMSLTLTRKTIESLERPSVSLRPSGSLGPNRSQLRGPYDPPGAARNQAIRDIGPRRDRHRHTRSECKISDRACSELIERNREDA